MNSMPIIACLWLLSGTLLVQVTPCLGEGSNIVVPTPSESKPVITENPVDGELKVTPTTLPVPHPEENIEDKNDTIVLPSNSSTPNTSITTTSTTISTTKSTEPSPTTTTTSTTPTVTTTPPTTPTTTTEPTKPTTTTAQSSTTPEVTSSSPVSTATPSPTKTPTSAPETDRRFDGPSFIGGIVFALGVTAIGFVAWKFYKARTDRNYHTL